MTTRYDVSVPRQCSNLGSDDQVWPKSWHFFIPDMDEAELILLQKL